jgi:hypothetical protein
MDGSILLQHPMNSGELQGATLANIIPDLDNNGSYEILGASDDGKIVALSGGTDAVTGIDEAKNISIPGEFRLSQNYPNPFNPLTTIDFAVPGNADVEIIIFDVLGRRIRSYLFKNRNAGSHRVIWDGKNEQGKAVPSGIYIYQARMGSQKISKQMLLLK